VPLQDWNLKATFDTAYGFNAEPDGHPNTRQGVRLHYHRGRMLNSAQRIADYFHNYFGPAAYNNRFVVVGGGFGWAAGELLDRGFTNIVVVETSQYVLDNMDLDDEAEVRAACVQVGLSSTGDRANELVGWWARPGVPRRRRRQTPLDVPIVNEDILTSAGRTAIRNALNPSGNPQIVVTEDVLGVLDDTEAVAFADACSAWGGQQTVVHLVTPLMPEHTQAPGYNWKLLADWKLLIPGDIWIDAVTGEVLE
jgi:hypothetical protein